MDNNSTQEVPTSSSTIPYLTLKRQRALYCYQPDCSTIDVMVQVANQSTLPAAVHGLFTRMRADDLEMDVAAFTRMWRTILLHRVQECYIQEKCFRPPNYMRLLSPPVICPAPLADLLESMGSFHHAPEGVYYHVVPPVQADELEDFWKPDSDIITLWLKTCNQLAPFYTMRSTPSKSDFKNKSIVLTTTAKDGHLVMVKTKYKSCNISDGLIHAVNDPLFPPNHFPFDESHITILSTDKHSLVRDHIDSYIIHPERD